MWISPVYPHERMTEHRLYEHILVPTDGSAAAEEAVEHALAIAAAHEAQLHGLFVIDSRITMAADEEMREGLTEQLRRNGEKAVDHIVARAADLDLEVTTDVTRGTPWKMIQSYATDNGIDLIVIGTTGKTPREKRMGMGSVSERVVDDSAVPVLVVPDSTTKGV